MNIPKNVVVVGLAGKARSGKDTAARALEARWPGGPVLILALAEPIRRMLHALVGKPWAYAQGDAKEGQMPGLPDGTSPRKMLQTLGDWGRAIDKDLWVKSVVGEINEWVAHWSHRRPGAVLMVIVPDVRYDNEAQAIRDLGGFVLKIERESTAPVREHSSEAGISDGLFDAVIVNDGSEEQFSGVVAQALNAIASQRSAERNEREAEAD